MVKNVSEQILSYSDPETGEKWFHAEGSESKFRSEWVAYTPEVAVCWEHSISPEGDRSKTMVGLHIYGEADTENIRSLPLSLIHRADPADYPSWPIDGLVPASDVSDYTPNGAVIKQKWLDRGTPKKKKKPAKITSRKKNEAVEDFYRRVADSYRYFATQTSKPTQAMADEAQVKRTTAARWVHEARKRNYLEKTRAGRVTR